MAEEIDLARLQEEIVGVPHNLILPENIYNEQHDLKVQSVRKIVELYRNTFDQRKVRGAMADKNPFVRIAAAEVLSAYGNNKAATYLFKALEDEDNVRVKQEIVKAIDQLEARLNGSLTDNREISIVSAMRLLSCSV